eukprot:350306-Chlamydomonas_euryale.AAC.8
MNGVGGWMNGVDEWVGRRMTGSGGGAQSKALLLHVVVCLLPRPLLWAVHVVACLLPRLSPRMAHGLGKSELEWDQVREQSTSLLRAALVHENCAARMDGWAAEWMDGCMGEHVVGGWHVREVRGVGEV